MTPSINQQIGLQMTWDYDKAPTDPRHGGKLTAEMAAERIAEIEAIVHRQRAMLEEIAEAAGFKRGDTYSAGAIIAKLKGNVVRNCSMDEGTK